MKKIIIFILLFIFFLKPSFANAEIIRSFDVNITAHENGLMDVVETINYDFENEYRHGIFRDIPTFSKVGDLYRITKIENVGVLRDLQNENFSLTSDSKNLNIKIGDANKTITGSHTYKISYTVENGIGSNFQTHDEIYWNATGNKWQVAIEKASITISTDFSSAQKDFICFTGFEGSKDKNCQVSGNSASTLGILSPGEGLTAVSVYLVNTFPKSILSKQPPITLAQKIFSFILGNSIYILIFLNLIIAPYLIYWYQKHKNKKRFGPPAVNFDIPKDENGQIIRPALAGTIDTTTLEIDDVVATVFDLAIRKYIKLEGTKTVRSLMPDLAEQKIIKLKEDDENLNSYEKKLYDRLFESGDSVNVSDLKIDFYKTFSDMEKDVFAELVEKNYYTKNPKNQKVILVVFAWLSFLSVNVILSIILFFLSFKLNGRTSKGDEIDYKIDGLKLFLKSMDRNYKWQAEKFYVVEQMIPYAMALGYIDKFMEQLKLIQPDYNPSWYSGGKGSFYAGYAGFYLAASSGITTAALSSSSGFSGGSSGGGGGGGGGGSW